MKSNLQRFFCLVCLVLIVGIFAISISLINYSDLSIFTANPEVPAKIPSVNDVEQGIVFLFTLKVIRFSLLHHGFRESTEFFAK